MRILSVILFCIGSLNLQAQNKEEIIKELKNVFSIHSTSSGFKNTEIYYNSGEKILDIGYYLIDLKITKIIYESTKDEEGTIHLLSFSCENLANCIKTDADPAAAVSAFFDNKKSVYEAIDLIYELKKTE